jgi:3,5-epimerase/4-reductase
MKIIFFGVQGWIASYFLPIIRERGGVEVLCTEVRADDTPAVSELLDNEKPDRVISFIGRTHGPGYSTIDYLEQPGKLVENVRDNLFAPVSLAILCAARGIHLTYLGTGCIFSDEDPRAHAYGEAAVPNFFGSSYSVVKGFTDRLMHLFEDHVLNVRIRMPITDDWAPRNFITKIVNYPKICSMPNSMTVLPTLLPVLADLVMKRHTGTINLCNPGLMDHNEILCMYKEMVDPGHTWENMSVEDQNKILLSKRSNNQLDTGLLESMYPSVPSLREDVRAMLERMNATKCESNVE